MWPLPKRVFIIRRGAFYYLLSKVWLVCLPTHNTSLVTINYFPPGTRGRCNVATTLLATLPASNVVTTLWQRYLWNKLQRCKKRCCKVECNVTATFFATLQKTLSKRRCYNVAPQRYQQRCLATLPEKKSVVHASNRVLFHPVWSKLLKVTKKVDCRKTLSQRYLTTL